MKVQIIYFFVLLSIPTNWSSINQKCANGSFKFENNFVPISFYCVCVKDCGIQSQKYQYDNFFACFIGKIDSSYVKI